ncbi:hypothetical protein lerEdw1_005085 [Lerista edwardsae]|nr:hypothetical protein lerEdw1_005085 [Lerista edwardsae]
MPTPRCVRAYEDTKSRRTLSVSLLGSHRYFWVWLLCTFCPIQADTIELTDMFGEIQSPNFPDSYPSDSEATWNISVPDGFRVKLYFMHFDLESSYLCEYDYVKVSTLACGQLGAAQLAAETAPWNNGQVTEGLWCNA